MTVLLVTRVLLAKPAVMAVVVQSLQQLQRNPMVSIVHMIMNVNQIIAIMLIVAHQVKLAANMTANVHL